MANPQLEDGHTKIVNSLFEAIMRYPFTRYEWQIVMCIIRNSYGWNRKDAVISLGEFNQATGIHRTHALRTVKALVLKNIIIVKKINLESSYSIQKNYEKWVIPEKLTVTSTGHETLPLQVTPVACTGHETLPLQVTPPPADSINNAGLRVPKDKKDILKTEINKYIVVFEELWSQYPSKDGRIKALKHFNASVRCDEDVIAIRKAIANYLSHLQTHQWKQPKAGSTWFYNWRDWVNWKESENGKSGKFDKPKSQNTADRAAEVFKRIGQNRGYSDGRY